jgi:hypothetical protein
MLAEDRDGHLREAIDPRRDRAFIREKSRYAALVLHRRATDERRVEEQAVFRRVR